MAHKWWTLTAVCTGVFMLLLDITIVNVALPDIQLAFSASLTDLQWVISAYALTLAAFLLTAGSLADRFGRRRLFAIGLVAFTLGSLLCGMATSSLFLILARAGQGVGGAIMFATSLALLADAFRGRDRGVAFGVFGAITGVAVAVGPVLGGAITTGLSWRWIFFVNLPVGVLALAVTLTRVAESRDPRAGRPDLARFLTFSLGLAALVYGLIQSVADGWALATVIGSLIEAAVLLVVFFFIERSQTHPMLDQVGAGLVNVPLISTAVGVVEPARAGMASGINSTLRQVGIATGVAGLGSIFAAHIHSSVSSQLAGTALADQAGAIGQAISNGGAARAIASAPDPLRAVVAQAGRSSFIGGLNLILLVGAVVAFTAAVGSFLLIREKDFVSTTDGETAPPQRWPEVLSPQADSSQERSASRMTVLAVE